MLEFSLKGDDGAADADADDGEEDAREFGSQPAFLLGVFGKSHLFDSP